MTKRVQHILFGLLVYLVTGSFAANAIELANLRCEQLPNPEGIGTVRPRLSWEIRAPERGIIQTAYQVQVASSLALLESNRPDLWDSDKKSSNNSVYVSYAGKPLKSRTSCYWRVKVWTNKGESSWSTPQYWSVGLLHYTDWKGRWIGLDRSFAWDSETQFSRLSARYFRKEFQAEKKIKQAKLYIMGLGLYELYLNGKKIGKQVLAPAPTDYTKEVKYNTFDVTGQLSAGLNTIGIILGNGRYYTMRQDYKPYKIKTFGYPKLRLNVEITYEDGSKSTVVSDNSWKVTADGPIRTNNEYDGEEYDATKELVGWAQNGFDDKQWLDASFVQEPGGMPTAQMNECMQVMDTLSVRSIHQIAGGKYILDMGQNMTGWLKMHVQGSRGTRVQLRFAESLQEDGSLYLANLRDAKVTDVYTLKGEGSEHWQPRFVYHGFRYVEVSGYPGVPTTADFEGLVIYDALNQTGAFRSDHQLLNQLYQNAFWGIAGNYKGMPIDCPQRNERQPWLGDRTTGAYGESFLFDNAKLYAKWLDDIEGAQTADGSIPDVAPAFWRYYSDNVTWPATYFTVADMLYQQYGDVQPIIQHYASMKKWIDYMAEQYLVEGILVRDKYGDWCVPPESKELIHAKDPKRLTEGALLATSTYYYLLQLMQKFAVLSGNDADIILFKQQSARIQKAFNARFLHEEAGYYGNNTVTANLLPLSFGIVPNHLRQVVFQHIVQQVEVENKGHISTGVIGTQWLMRGLTDHGRPDLAFKLATNTTYPSWGYMLAHGATTIWELWNGDTANPQMNSQNHVMLLGDLLIWYYQHLAGIKALEPGFKRIEMKPRMHLPLKHVQASYHSIYGNVTSEWKKNKEVWEWEITVPPNCSAEVYIPGNRASIFERNTLAERGENIRFLRNEAGKSIFEIGSGNYHFKIKQ